MRTRLTTGIVALITAAAMTFPAAGLADKGGVPHKTPPACHMHKHNGNHKGTRGMRKGASKGNKCGQSAS